jgi:hypothetical protein
MTKPELLKDTLDHFAHLGMRQWRQWESVDSELSSYCVSGRRPTTPEFKEQLAYWSDIAREFENRFGQNGDQKTFLSPKSVIPESYIGMARERIGILGGAIQMDKLFHEGAAANGYVVETESGRKNYYISAIGLRLNVPFDTQSDVYCRAVSDRTFWEFKEWRSGRVPVMLLDMDINVVDGEVIVYEVSRHKFNWPLSIHKSIFVPDTHPELVTGTPDKDKPLKEEHPAVFALYEAAGLKLRRDIGPRLSDFARFGISQALGIAAMALGDTLSRLWVYPPADILTYRHEDLFARQTNLHPFDEAMRSVLPAFGEVKQDKQSGWLSVEKPCVS